MDVSDTEEFAADMMSLLVSFSGKFYGKRSAEQRKMSKNKKHCRTCTICKFSKIYNRFGYLEFPQLGWILICTNKCNKHFGKRYLDVVETKEIPFSERCKCLCVDDDLKRIADENDARRELLKKLDKKTENQETYGTSAQPFPDNTWSHCLQITSALSDYYLRLV